MDSVERLQVHDIIITHFVNPNEFWYKYETNIINEKLYDLETRIQEYFLKKQRNADFNIPYIPKINETVAVFNRTENRWIRAIVDHVYEFRNDDNKYILWATDYGKPLMSPPKHMRKLPDVCANYEIETVFFGGINNVLPAEKVYDFMTNSSKTTITNKWSEKSIKTCENILDRLYTCTFHIEKYHNGQNFGQLEITTDMNKQLNIRDVLIEINDGIYKTEGFYDILKEHQLNKSPRWLQPNGNCNLFKFNHNSQNIQQITMPPPQQMLKESDKINNQRNISLQQQLNLTPFLDHNCYDEILAENQAKVNEKVKNWNEHNQRESFITTNDMMPISDNNFDDMESISVAGAIIPENLTTHIKISQKEENIKKVTIEKNNNPEQHIGRTTMPKVVPPLPRNNDPNIVPGFDDLVIKPNLSVDVCKLNSNATVTTALTHDDDNKSTVSVETGLSTIRLKFLQESRMRAIEALAKKQMEPQKTIHVPAGYDLGQLNQKKNDDKYNTSSSTSSSNYCSNRKEQNKIRSNKSTDIVDGRSARASGERFNNCNLIEPKKISNSPMNYKAPSTSQESSQNYRQQRIKVDNTLHNVNEVCVPTSSIGKDSVLVHGTIPKPIDKITEAKFTSDIHTEMERIRITKIYRIQQYAWPHLARLNSLILVNSRRTGKTYSYLPIVCSLINNQKDDGEIPDGVGPIGLIVIPHRKEAQDILDKCRRFTKKNILCTGERDKVEAMGNLQSNADLLICTPEGINLLMNNNNNIKCFSQKRLKHLIIEDLNLWYEHEHDHTQNRQILKDIFKKFQTHVQIILISLIWDSLLEEILSKKLLNNPLLCIGAPIEAAVYAKTKFKLKIVQKDEKVGVILGFIKKHNYRDEKLIIICNNDEDVKEVSNNLKNAGHFVTSCTKELKAQDIREITTNWNNNSHRENFILITSDDSLVQLEIQNAQNLIHYTLSTSWTRTCYRFSVFLKYYNDRIKESTVNNQPRAETLILLDKDNNDQLPKLVHFLERNNAEINAKIKKLAECIKSDRMMNCHNNMPLCEKWLEFGKYHNKSKCDKRHVITYIDAPPIDLPSKGYAEIQIISCESPIHFCVRILKHKLNNEDNWQITRQSNEFVKFNIQFTNYFSNSDNHQLYHPIMYNELCVIKVHEKYDRGRIIRILKTNKTNQTVYVKLIDSGQIKAFRADHLLYLPEQFKEFPPQCVDLYLANVIPYDEEEIWNNKLTEKIKDSLEKYNKNHRMLAYYINFTLSDTIYADEIVVQEYLDSLKTYNNKIYIKKDAIKKNILKKIDDFDSSEILVSAKKMFHKPEICKSLELSNKSPITDDISNGKFILDDQKILTKLSDSSTITSSSLSLSSTGEITNQMVNLPLSTIVQRGRRNLRSRSKNSEENSKIKEKSTKDLIVRESWEMLPENEFSKISIGFFNSPDDFYVAHLYDIKKLDSLYKKINDFITNGAKCVEKAFIGSNYLAKYQENYNRCKITGFMCDSNALVVATVFFCDIGVHKNCKISEIRTSNTEIINVAPYQAIRCKLIGITPTNISGLWTDQDSDSIYNILRFSNAIYARPMVNAKQNNDNVLKYWTYEVILVDCTTDKDIQYNKEIISKGYALKDPQTSHYLDLDYNGPENPGNYDNGYSDHDTDEEWEDNPNAKTYQYQPVPNGDNLENNSNAMEIDYDINFTTEETLEFWNLPPNALLPETNRPIEKDNVIKPISNNNANKEIIKESKELNEIHKNSTKLNDMPKLKCNYKIPTVIWQQSEELICLKVSAPDIEDYYLNVTNSNVHFTADIAGEINVLQLNLFGYIDESVVSHEIRGLNVIIRLLKKVTGKRFSWPRLTKESDKHNWLKYNYDSIIMEHEKFENSVPEVQAKPCTAYTNDSDSEFDENIEYETYNRIENPEDVYDVLGEV